MFVNNGWSVKTKGDLYEITDSKGNLCITTKVRVIDKDTIVIEHPYIQADRVDTRTQSVLSPLFRGNLLTHSVDSYHETIVSEGTAKLVKTLRSFGGTLRD